MKYTYIILIFYIITSTFGFGLSANEPQEIFFEHLHVEDGLSQFSVNSIYQDEFGIVWIGTRAGLNRYDGFYIKNMRSTDKTPTSIYGDNVQQITGDKTGSVYLNCNYALVEYSIRKQAFTTLRTNGVLAIAHGTSGLWVASKDSVFLYNKENSTLNFSVKLTEDIGEITSLYETDNKELYIGTKKGGLFVHRRTTGYRNIIAGIDIIKLYEDSRSQIWVTSRRNGLYRLGRDGYIKNYVNDPFNSKSISNNFTRCIVEDNFGNYWIGTYDGLNKLNSSDDSFTLYNTNPNQPQSLGNPSIWCLTKDKQGTIWLGSYYGGVDYFNPQYAFYKHYFVSNLPNTLHSSIFESIEEDMDANLWIATERGGVCYFDRVKNTFETFTYEPNKNSLSAPTAKSLWLDDATQTLWIGTFLGGLNKLDLRKKHFKVYTENYPKRQSLINNVVRKIIPHKGKLLLATQNTVGVFDPETEICEFLFDENERKYLGRQVWDMVVDKDDRLWFATSTGTYCCNLQTKELKKYELFQQQDKSPTHLNVFFIDTKNRIWMGSAGRGLAYYTPDDDSFTVLSQDDGLIDDYVVAINETKSGHILAATSQGLSRLDVEKRIFYNYNQNNGFPITAIMDNAVFVTKNGEIFIGGTNGLISFFEENLENEPHNNSIIITNIRVNNRDVFPDDKDKILKESSFYTEEITLLANHTVISIDYSNGNYIKALRQDVEYRLIGLDENWTSANFQNRITYTNLTSGSYTLELRSKDGRNIKSIKIVVKPPFYRSWYALILYIFVLAGVVYYIASSYLKGLYLKNTLEIERRDKQRIEELNKSKLQFFTNVSHEFRTPLTLIIGHAETLLQSDKLPQPIYRRLLSILKSSTRLQKLITELLDFQKHEQGYIHLNKTKNDITEFIKQVSASFTEHAKERNIKFKLNLLSIPLYMSFDHSQFEKVIYNVLSNAFKYTKDNGMIELTMSADDTMLIISIKDNGMGIQNKDLPYIFDRFFQAENAIIKAGNFQSSGIGLSLSRSIVEAHNGKISVQSNRDRGSEFTIHIPIVIDDDTRDEEPEKGNPSEWAVAKEPDMVLTERNLEQENKDTILIVEDNAELLLMLEQVFNAMYNVSIAKDGVDGFDKALNIQPDLIITDVMMPNMTGTELCAKIKSNLQTCHIPVILLTSLANESCEVEGLQTGADDYITKPFNIKALKLKVNNFIKNRKQYQHSFISQPQATIQNIATNKYDKELLEKIISTLDKHIYNPQLDVSLLAKETCLGRTTLFSKIKGITGKTPNEFILSTKLKKSLELLSQTPIQSINDIADKLNFSSTSYYIKCFKDMYGVTPKEYRNKT